MKNISISAFVNMIFLIAFTAIVAALIFFITLDKERHQQQEEQRYTLIADAFLSGFQFLPTDKQLKRLFNYFKVDAVQDSNKKLQIIKNTELLFVKESVFGRVRVFGEKKDRYIYVQKFGYNLMLKDLKPKEYSLQIAFFLFGLISGILIALYMALMKKLYPLRSLHQQIEKFAKGDLSVRVAQNGNDEIGKIAKSFNKAIEHINHLISSKNLFMRNMMHELKTPITKGRIVVETIEEGEDKEILIRAFERMNEIITELAQVEKLTSNTLKLHKEQVFFSELVQDALRLLMCKEESIVQEIDEFYITVDRGLFTIVLKNLIDNAIKFSPNQQAIIRASEKNIQIISEGKPLAHPLAYYTEPFSQEEKRNSGFGLGLYIVKTVLDVHGFILNYEYKEGKNSFIIA